MSYFDVEGIPLVQFEVEPVNSRWPGIRYTGSSEPPIYAATVRVVGATNRRNLLRSRSRADNYRQSMGASGWDAFVDSGPDAGVLSVPKTRGILVTWDRALLVSIQEESEPSMVANIYYIICEWKILDVDPYPV